MIPAFNGLFLVTKVVFNNIANNNIPSVTRVEQSVPRQPVIIHFSLKKWLTKRHYHCYSALPGGLVSPISRVAPDKFFHLQ